MALTFPRRGGRSTIGKRGQGLTSATFLATSESEPAHEVERALLILSLDRKKHFTVRREIADSMTEDCVGDGGGQEKAPFAPAPSGYRSDYS